MAALPASSPTPPEERPSPGAAPGASSTPTLGPHQGSSTAGGSSGNSTALAFGIIAVFLAAGLIIFRLYFRGSCCALMAPLRRGESGALAVEHPALPVLMLAGTAGARALSLLLSGRRPVLPYCASTPGAVASQRRSAVPMLRQLPGIQPLHIADTQTHTGMPCPF